MKKIISLLLVAVLVFTLAACGAQKQAEDKPGAQELSDAQTMVYTSSFKELDCKDVDTLDYLEPMLVDEDAIYCATSVKVGENIPEGVVPSYEGQYDVYAPRIYVVKADGSVADFQGFEPTDLADSEHKNEQDYSVSSSVMSIMKAEDGSFVVTENVYEGWTSSESLVSVNEFENYMSEQHVYFHRISATGELLQKSEVDLGDNEYISFSNSCLDDNGNVLTVGDLAICAFDQNGTLAYQIPTEDWVYNMMRYADGKIYVSAWDESGVCAREVNTEAKTLGESKKLPQEAFSLVRGANGYDLFYLDGIYLYGYKMDGETKDRILDLVDCDVNLQDIRSFRVNEDMSVYGLSCEFSEEATVYSVFTIKATPDSETAQKKIITLGSLNGPMLSDAVVKFNRHNNDVKIVIKDYSDYVDGADDYSAAITKLTTELISGEMPDILDLDNLPYERLAAKGLLSDLYSFMDNDAEHGRDKYFANVLKAMEVDGKLYEMTGSFGVSSLMGSAKVVGDKAGWTLEDLLEAWKSMPENCSILDPYETKSNMLSTLLAVNMHHLVNWTTGECKFNTEMYTDMLEFANLFPAEFNADTYDWENEKTSDEKLASGEQMLMMVNISSPSDLQWNTASFGGKATCVGYPTADGQPGHGMDIGKAFAITEKCEEKDAAWKFICEYIDRYGSYGIPLNISKYNDLVKDAMTPEYQVDENGEFVLDENGNKIEIPKGGMIAYDIDSTKVPGLPSGGIYAMTQEEADALYELLSTPTSISSYQNEINDIALQGAEAYFAGQKTAEEVANLTQSRVSLYVNEQR